MKRITIIENSGKEELYRKFIIELINGYDGEMDLRTIVGRCVDLGFTLEPKFTPLDKPTKKKKK